MSAYASTRQQPGALHLESIQNYPVREGARAIDRNSRLAVAAAAPHELAGSVVDEIVDQLAERIAAALADTLAGGGSLAESDEWLDSRHAADYLGVHRDTLRKLAAR
jgi:hypothetical protein